jgi:hypothetical protein
MQTPTDSRSLECLQIWLERYRTSLPKGLDFLSSTEAFTYNNVEDLNDFISVRRPKSDRDAFQETLTPKLVAAMYWFEMVWDVAMDNINLGIFWKSVYQWCKEKVLWCKKKVTSLCKSF